MDFLKQSRVGPSYSRANGTMVQEVPLLENNVIINPVSRELVRYGHRMEDKFTNLNRQIQTLKEKKINLEESLLKSGLTSKKKNKSQAQNSLSEQIKNLEQSIKSLEKKSKRMKERTNKFLKRSNAQDLMERRYFDELLRRQAYKTRYGRGYSINHGGILQVLRNKFGQYIGPKSGMHHYDERSINGSYFYKTPSNLLIPPAPQPQKLIKNATPKNKNYLKKLQREQRKKKNNTTKNNTKKNKNYNKNDPRSPNYNITAVNGGSKFVHIPNHGRRKVRYQKNGRAYVIVNKKKLKL